MQHVTQTLPRSLRQIAGVLLASITLLPTLAAAQAEKASSKSPSITGVIEGIPGLGIFLAPTGGCQPAATGKSDVINCMGTVSGRVGGKGGNDTITVDSAASMTAAASNSTAKSVGIDGGGGRDIIVNDGDITVSSTGETANSTGIAGAAGKDDIQNNGTIEVISIAENDRLGINVVVGRNAPTEAVATATGIDGGNAKDQITNAGTVSVTANSEASSKDFNVNADFGKLDASTHAKATATGIDGGKSNDTITNSGSLNVDAKADASSFDLQLNGADIFAGNATVNAEAEATGIAAGSGTGTITNSGDMTVTSHAIAESVSPEFSFFDRAEADATTSAVAKSTGIQSGPGESVVTNGSETDGSDKLEVTATAESTALSGVIGIKAPTRLVAPGPESKFNAVTDATATGITSGDKKDLIKNFAETNVTATATSSSANGTYEKDGAANVQAVANSQATAMGIDAGAGNNEIINTSTLAVTADATSHSLDIGINQTDDLIPIPSAVELVKGKPPETDAERIAAAHATGITSGGGDDQVTNSGSITADAKSLALSEAASVSLEVESKEEPKKGGKNPGKIKKILQKAKSLLGTVSKVLDLDPLNDAAIDTSVNAEADSVGITAGDGANVVANDGSIKGTADARAFGSSALLDFTFTKEENPKGKWFVFKPGLAKSQSTAIASANGIRTGSGNDLITNNNEINFTAKATANSLGVTAINQPKLSGVGLTAAMSDTSTITVAGAAGVSSGAGNDAIINNGTISATSESKTFAESVGVNVETTGNGVEIGAALTNSNTTAVGTAVGIDADGGQDQVINNDTLIVAANTRANSLSGSVAVQGAVNGVGLQGALSNSTTAATAVATGIKSTDGLADTLVNVGVFDEDGKLVKPGTMNVTADAGAFAESASVGVQLGGNGLEVSGALTKSDTTTDAQAIGIDSTGNGSIVGNGGDLTVNAIAKSNSLGISVGVQTGVDGLGISGALSDTTTKTDAVAVGIKNSGIGNGQIGNSGTLTAQSDSRAFAESVGVNVQMGGGGVSAGAALTLSGTRADSAATGIDTGSETKSVVNSGDVTGDATAVGNSLGASFGFQDSATGVGLSGALSDAKTESYATGTGISSQGPIATGLFNAGNIAGKADAQAYSEAASIDIQAGGTGLDVGATLARSGTLAESNAKGVELGGGNHVDNYGSVKANADVTANSLGIGLAAIGSVKGVGLQGALTDTETIATARSTAVDFTSGKNSLRQYKSGEITAEADSTADARSVSVELGGFSNVGASVGAALARSGVNSEATAAGITGGSGGADVTMDGSLTAKSKADADAVGVSVAFGITQAGFGAQGAAVDATTDSLARSTGVATGAAVDTIDMQSEAVMDISATATTHGTAVSAGITGTTSGVALGAALARATTEANAESAAIESGAENDQIINRGAVTSTATAESNAVGVAVGMGVVQSGVAFEGTAADTSTQGNAQSTLFDGGTGDDHLENYGETTAEAASTVNSTSVSVDGSVASAGLGVGAALGRATTEGEAHSTGMAGDAGNDTMINGESGSIVSTATVNTRAVGALVGIGFTESGVALSGTGGDASAKGTAVATAIFGGAGNDTLQNDGNVQARSTANVDSDTISVNLSGTVAGVSIGGALARAETEGKATSAGISGDSGDDTLINHGTVTSDARSGVKTVGVSVGIGVTGTGVAVEGTAVDGSAQGLANAAGMAGGAGVDTIYSQGAVDTTSTAEVTTAGVSVSGSGTVTGVGVGVALSRAATTAVANATAIAGDDFKTEIDDEGQIVETNKAGDGNDVIENHRSENAADPHGVTATAKADADAASVSVAVGLTGTGLQAGGALADLHNNAVARAIGISGGAGDDTINNYDTITADADARTTGASVSVALQGTVAGVAVGVALTDATTKAKATSTAISGDEGNDGILNTAVLDSRAKARSTATSVAVSAPIAVVPVGAALSDSSAEAEARAYGISGGAGNDVIDNQGAIKIGVFGAEEGGADAKAVGTSVSASVLGASIGDANAVANSSAVGIDGGAGEDTIGNSASITATSKAKSTGTSVTVGLVGASIGDARAEATAGASGIRGGSENDTIVNDGNLTTDATADARGTSVNVTFLGAALGNILRDARTTATAVAKGIEGHDGDDGIVNSKTVKATSYATASDVSVNVVLPNVGGGAAIGKVGAEAHATSVGIDGGEGKDTIESKGNIDLSATASAPGVSVDVNLQGAGAAAGDGHTSAEAVTKGISAGAGDDTVISGMMENEVGQPNAVITGVSDAKTGTTGVSVNLIGAASVNANIDATARGTGIDGGDGDDTLINLGSIDWTAKSDARNTGVSVNLGGAALGGATTLSSATATGMDGGSGDDTVINRGIVNVTADAKTKSGGVSVSLAGDAEADSNIQAIANAVGIGGGSGGDHLENHSTLKATAKADAPANSVNVNIAGAALGDANTRAEAKSTGIQGGDGDDTLLNFSTLEAKSTATTNANNVSVLIAGLASTSKDELTATTASTGIAGGKGRDTIASQGEIKATADATTTVTGSSVNIFGVAKSGGTTNTDETAVGIDGGDENDVISNFAKMTVGSTGTMTIDKGTFDFGGVASADGALISNTRATGIAGGAGVDSIYTENDVQITANAHLTATGNTTAAFGSASAEAGMNANASATGIDGGDDAVVAEDEAELIIQALANAGTLKVTSTATMTSTRPSFTVAGNANSDALLEATSQAVGIAGSAGDDMISNSGTVDVSATSTQTATGGSKAAVAGGGTASAQSIAKATATGIDAGAAENVVVNAGSVLVDANPGGNVTNSSSAGFLFGSAGAVSQLNLTATSRGVLFGEQKNTLFNTGLIDVTARSSGLAKATADGADVINGDTVATATSTVNASAFGITGGASANQIDNQGVIKVVARPAISADASANGNGADGDGTAKATGKATGNATGIKVGDGANQITNDNMISVSATPTATANSFADSDAGGTARSTASATANASATGISAGNGGNWIVNNGTLMVMADPDGKATAKGTVDQISVCIPFTRICATVTIGNKILSASSPESAAAIGIQTGSGDDAIVNNGTISTTKVVEDVTSNGIAISSGAGNDVVILGDGSSTTGSIELGTGNDTLHLIGTPVVNGNIDTGSGANSLVFEGNGSFANPLNGFVNALKQGTGTYTLPTLSTVTEKLEVREGTLQINNNYQMAPGSAFETTVNGDGSSGQLKVNGTADLNGSLVVDKGPGVYVNGTTYDVVSANNVTGAFNSEQLPAPTALVSFSTNQAPTAFQVQANVASFTTVATNGVAVSLAKYLDQITPKVNGDLARVIGNFQQLSKGDFGRGFSSLSQESYQPIAAASFNTLQRYSGVLHTRLNMMRAAFRGMPLAEAVDRTDLGQEAYLAQFGFTPLTLDVFDRGAAQSAMRQSGFWLSGFGNAMGQGGGGGFSGFNHRTSGIPVGFDFRLTDGLIVGAAATQSHSVLSIEDNYGEGRGRGAMTTVYGSYFTDRGELEGMVTYGRDSYQSVRQIDFGGINRGARSELDSDIFAARFEGRYHFNLDALKLEPFASMQYSRVRVGGFREQGAGDLDLIVGQHSVDALASQLGFRFVGPMNFSAGTLIPELTAAWQHDFRVGNNSIPASFRGAEQEQFSIARPDDSGSALKLGGALTFIGNRNFSAAAGVNAVLGKSKPEASGLLQLQFRW